MIKGEYYQDNARKENLDFENEYWICNRCASNNYPNRKICFRCKLKKGEEAPIEEPSQSL